MKSPQFHSLSSLAFLQLSGNMSSIIAEPLYLFRLYRHGRDKLLWHINVRMNPSYGCTPDYQRDTRRNLSMRLKRWIQELAGYYYILCPVYIIYISTIIDFVINKFLWNHCKVMKCKVIKPSLCGTAPATLPP